MSPLPARPRPARPRPAPPRLVASDLDGTLLDGSGALTERTARAWRALDDAGIASVIVTARPPRWVEHLAALAGEHGVVICANGAFVYDVARRSIREQHGIGPDLVAELIADLRRIEGTVFSAELADGFHRETGYPVGGIAGAPEHAPAGVGSLESLPGPVGKLLARNLHLPAEEFLARVREVVGERAVLSTSCGDGLAEIGPAGISKASALATWCMDRGIDAADVWAFGDMPNDLPMIRWAGTGWAVANAHAELLAAADRVCPANTEDGVAAALEAMLADRPDQAPAPDASGRSGP